MRAEAIAFDGDLVGDERMVGVHEPRWCLNGVLGDRVEAHAAEPLAHEMGEHRIDPIAGDLREHVPKPATAREDRAVQNPFDDGIEVSPLLPCVDEQAAEIGCRRVWCQIDGKAGEGRDRQCVDLTDVECLERSASDEPDARHGWARVSVRKDDLQSATRPLDVPPKPRRGTTGDRDEWGRLVVAAMG